ncbi:hypothetical protein GQ55_9G010000 [Panicum hallii var. hallii]|uniref:Uncharacterized protein n=1 Tax=Panicum hallii var. hallii TaxID=1504633 RepID=A0A2T7BYJ1_9POAL|nr:hypothetical protein GQ55_9G010000 [Panicum hallii var. hallii]
MGRGACRGCRNTDQDIGAHAACLSAQRHVRARRAMATQKGRLIEPALRRASACGGDGVLPFGVRAPALSSSWSLVTVGTGQAGDAADADLFQEGRRGGNQVQRASAASTGAGRHLKSPMGVDFWALDRARAVQIGLAEDKVVVVRQLRPRGSWMPPAPWRRPEAQVSPAHLSSVEGRRRKRGDRRRRARGTSSPLPSRTALAARALCLSVSGLGVDTIRGRRLVPRPARASYYSQVPWRRRIEVDGGAASATAATAL